MKASIKLALSLLILIASLFLLRFSGWFGLGALVGLILSILYWFDTAAEIQDGPTASRGVRVLGMLMGIPQAFFGLLCAGVGLAIIVWVLYNTLIERQSEYTGGFLTFGIGPILVLVGGRWILSAFRRNRDRPND